MSTRPAALSIPAAEPPALAAPELERIARAYDSEPWWYDLRGLAVLTFSYRSTLGRQLRFFGENMGPRHLEVAVGSGTLLDYVLGWRRRRGLAPPHIVAFDYAAPMLAGAVRRFRDRPEIELHRADAARLPFGPAAFDSVNVANAIHCIPDVDDALAEIERVLRPGGRVAMNVLLRPRGGWLGRSLAERINAWGQRKGILHRPYDLVELVARVRAAGLCCETAAVHGNTCHLVAAKVG